MKKSKNVLNEKNIIITKGEHAFKGFASTYHVEILNSFNPELQLKDTESVIKNKLLDLLSKFKVSTIIISNIQKSLRKCLGWIFQSLIILLVFIL